jgi:hypothetical protein
MGGENSTTTTGNYWETTDNMGGGPSLMYAASAIKAFDEFAGTLKI